MEALTPVLDAWMYARDIAGLYYELEDDLPEDNILDDHFHEAQKILGEDGTRGRVKLRSFAWGGEWASLEDKALEKIAAKVHGRIDLVVDVEGRPERAHIVAGRVVACPDSTCHHRLRPIFTSAL